MNTLDRYIAAHVLALSGIVALALTAIHTFISLVSQVDEIGQGDFGWWQLTQFVLLQLPTGLLTLVPIIAMLGTLLGLGLLASQSELTAMRASGVSLVRLGGATMIAALVLALIVVLLSEWLEPAGRRAAQALRTQARYGVDAGAAGKPVWLREGQHFIHIRRLLSEDRIADITVYRLTPELRVDEVLDADEGRWLAGAWVLHDVRRTALSDAGATASRLDTLTWHGGPAPEVLRLFVLEARSISTAGLVRLIGYLEANGLDAGRYHVRLWRKVVAPLTVLAMMLLAIPFVLGPLRDTGAGQRLLVGILLGVGFWVANEVTADLGHLYGWPPFLAAGAPTLLVLAIALYRLARFR